MNIEGKVALVTGASSGVGQATAVQLAKHGAQVMVNYCRSQSGAEDTVQQIQALGAEATTFQADVADDQQSCDLVAATLDHFGRIDILVNNAGTTRFIPFHDFAAATDEVWRDIMGVNVLGPFHLVRAVADHMRAQGDAEIVNVSSIAGLAATGSSIPYACSKAALNALTVALARTLAPHIRVNAVAPGFIAGRWLERGLGENYDQVRARFEKCAPLGKVSQPCDIASVIVGIIRGSDLVTGQVISCDGGSGIVDPMGLI